MFLAASSPSSKLKTIRLQQQSCAASACFEIFWARGKKTTPPYQANRRAESSRTLFELQIYNYTSYTCKKRKHDGLREEEGRLGGTKQEQSQGWCARAWDETT
jgi:hypothetical protein